MSVDRFPWHLMKRVQVVHRFMYAIGLGPLIGRIILLLTTTGRRSGRRYVTPLQYELIDGLYFVAPGRGPRCDWYRNLQADPLVHVRVRALAFDARAEAVEDPARIADFLEVRLRRHPRMVGAMMRMHDLPRRPTRAQLEALAATLRLVILHPLEA